MPVFETAGYAFIQPDILQPADVFLDRSGEDIRSRTYVFANPDGKELALRPDLTVPACRYHLERAPDPSQEARYCYSGPAFRFRPGASGEDKRAEFDQAGIEWFGSRDACAADAEVLTLAIAAIEAAGLKTYRVRTGDLGLFHALLETIEMPARWRKRLRQQFWRPREFRKLVHELSGERARECTSTSPLLDQVTATNAGELTARTLDGAGLVLAGGRTVDEIAERLAEKAADRTASPLRCEDSALIDSYLAMRGSPQAALVALEGMSRRQGGAMADAVQCFAARDKALNDRVLDNRGLDTGSFEFSAVFGRNLEYYTGFVFQIEVDLPDGGAIALAGGGRYDRLLSDIGSGEPIPAVGCAIHTERLLAAVAAA